MQQGRNKSEKRHFNPRPPWGGRRRRGMDENGRPSISIHALRGEGDAVLYGPE